MQRDLNLLTALDALLEEQSVTGAADRLHLSAPAMSRTLGRIRQATGDEILIRTGRTMQPTPRALALRTEVRALVLRCHEVLAPEGELSLGTLQRTFTIRAHDALLATLAPPLVRRVLDEAPGVTLRFVGEPREDTMDLQRGRIDIAVGSATPAISGIDYDRVTADSLVGLARRGHPLLNGDVDVAAWSAVPHVIVSRRGNLRDRVDELLKRENLSRRVVASVASASAAIEIVRTTDAVVVVPESVAERASSSGDIATFHLPVDLPTTAIVLSWHHRFARDRAHHWVRDLVRQTLTNQKRPTATARRQEPIDSA